MKNLIRSLLPLALLVAGTAASAGEVASLSSGDTLSGTVEEGILEVVPVDAAEASLLSVDLKMAAGSGVFFDVLNPDRTVLEGTSAFVKIDSKGSRAKGNKIPLLQSGRHFLRIRPAVPGPFTVKVKLKPLTKVSSTSFIAGDPASEFTFGAVPGALVTVKLAAAKKSGLAPRIAWLRNPSGSGADLSRGVHKVKSKSDQYSNVEVDELGTYTLGLSTVTGLFGDYGTLSIKIKFPRVKASKRDDADLFVDPFLDTVTPAQGFDNLAYESLALSGSFFTPDAEVRLEGEGGLLAATSTIRYNDDILGFDLDLSGMATGAYDLVVTLPSGGEGRLAGGFTVLPTPIPTSVSPSLGFDNRSQSFTVNGTRFQAGLNVVVVPTGGGTGISATVGTVTDTTADITVPLLNATLGLQDIVVTNPDGGTRTLSSGMTVDTGPRIVTAGPLLGHDNEGDFALTLSGSNFKTGMVVTLERSGQTTLTGVTESLTSSSCTAVFDLVGKAGGSWGIRATNTDGGTIVGSSALFLVAAPSIISLAPARGFQGEALTGAVATGTDFVSGAAATLERDGSTTVSATGEAVGGGGTTVTFDLGLTTAAAGEHDLRVVNPDAGTDLLPAAISVLGRRGVVASGTTGSAPAVAHNVEDAEYMVAYSVTTSGQKDIRARRYSAVTGNPVGPEIEVTSLSGDASSTEDQYDPAVVYAPAADLWFVVYKWQDSNAEGNTVKILGQFIDRTGNLISQQENAALLFGSPTGTLDRPRIAWNANREEWMVVWAWDVSAASDVYYGVYRKGTIGTFVIPEQINGGILIATTHANGSDTVPDGDFEPDVSWSSTTGEYLVCYSFDATETPVQGQGLPPDTGTDVRARFFDGNFSSGPVLKATLTNLGAVASRNERRGSVGYSSSSNRFMVAWDYDGGTGSRDLQAFLVEGTARTRVGSTATTLEKTSSEDALQAAVSFDPTPTTGGWRVAHAVAPGVAGTSRIEVALVPVSAAASGLGTPTWRTIAAAASGAGYSVPCIAVQGSGGEFIVGWTTVGTGLDPVEMRIWR